MNKPAHGKPGSFKTDWVVYTTVISSWINSTVEDKPVGKEIHRQTLCNVQALCPGVAMCSAWEKRAPLVTQHLNGKEQAVKTALLLSSVSSIFLNPVSGKQLDERDKDPWTCCLAGRW